MKLLIACLFLLPGGVFASPDAILSEAHIIHSDTQTVLPNGNIKAFGAVQIISGDMKIEADEAIFHRENPDSLFVTGTGAPIIYKGILEDGRPFSGHSLELKYVIESGELILTNKAFIRLQDSTLSASVITYNVKSKTMTATGSNDTRVFAVLYPNQLSDKISIKLCWSGRLYKSFWVIAIVSKLITQAVTEFTKIYSFRKQYASSELTFNKMVLTFSACCY